MALVSRSSHCFSFRGWALLLLAWFFPLALVHAQEDTAPPGNHPLWRSMGGYPGTSGPVHCTVMDTDGNLYVGGSFFIAGNARSHSVAKWDGVKWTSIAPPMIAGGTVHALAIDSHGHLYAGGSFRDIGGIPALRIAKWDGSRWHALGTGLGFNGVYASQAVKAIAFGPDGQLYAGGFFAEAGNTTVNHIARWDGSQWHALGQGVMDSSPSVNAMAFDKSGNLYATGRFQWANGTGTTVNHIAKWNGSGWSGLGSIFGTGLTGPVGPNVGHALEVDHGGNLIVAGSFRFAGGVQVNNIGRWNGSAWSAFGPAGPGAGFEALSTGVLDLGITAEGDVLAASRGAIVGSTVSYELVRWDGSAWVNAIPHPAITGQIRTFVILPNGEFILGGDFKKLGLGSGAFHASHLVRWDGARFHRFGNGPDGKIRVLKFDANNDLVVGGDFRTIGDIDSPGIARFDGNRWWPYGGGVDGEVHAIALDHGGALYAGGKFNTAGGIASKCIARWDGSQWQSVDGGLTQTGTVPMVRALALAQDGALYVGGLFSQSVSGTLLSGIARWHKNSWNNLNGGCLTSDAVPVSRNGDVKGLLFDASGHLIACGYFDRMGNGPGLTRHIARWDGSQWHPVGPTGSQTRPFDPYFGIECMAMSPNGVLHIGHNVYHSVSRLVSNSWQALASGFSGNPHAIAFDSTGGIYVGGIVTLTGSTILPRHVLRGVTLWNGTRWSSMGNEGLGMDKGAPYVLALAMDSRGNLMMAGDFLGSSNGVVSPFMIRTRADDYGFWPALGSLPPDRLGPLDRNGPLGLQNLAAYAMGLDPLLADVDDLPGLAVDQAFAESFILMDAFEETQPRLAPMELPTLKFRYRRSRTAADVETRVLASPDLVNWQPAEILTSEVLGITNEWESIEVTVPRDSRAKFLRLECGLKDDY